MNFTRYLIEADLNSALVIDEALSSIDRELEDIKQLKNGTNKKTPYKLNGVSQVGFILVDYGNLSDDYPEKDSSKLFKDLVSYFEKQSGLVIKRGTTKINDITKINFGSFDIILTPKKINVVDDNSGSWRLYILISVL